MKKIFHFKFSFAKSFKARDLKISLKSPLSQINLDQNFEFGRVASDHMVQIDFDDVNGWSIPAIKPLANLSIHPYNSTFHYAFSCFEGLKAYKDSTKTIRLFRPEKNMERFLRSCVRISLPSFDEQEMLQILKLFVKVEQNWIPTKEGSSYYIRPFAMSMGENIGVFKPHKSSIFIVGGPVTSYFSKSKIKLLVDETYHRGTPRNCASYKLASNYGPTVYIQAQAELQGFSQVIWSYEGNLLESGASNIFFLLKNEKGLELVTHPLDMSILPGVTRDSILHLANQVEKNIKISERPFHIDEFIDRKKKGELVEVFMSGTAAVITPVEEVQIREHNFQFDKDGKYFASRMKKYLLDIQQGKIYHPFSLII